MYIEGFRPFSDDFLEGETLKTMGRKVLEEAHEAEAEMERIEESGDYCHSALRELADTCQAVENALATLGARRADWMAAVADVRGKNRRRGRYGD